VANEFLEDLSWCTLCLAMSTRPRITFDAVATAHLFNFIGSGLESARNNLRSVGHRFPTWNYVDLA
jgi:hypothetical protein